MRSKILITTIQNGFILGSKDLCPQWPTEISREFSPTWTFGLRRFQTFSAKKKCNHSTDRSSCWLHHFSCVSHLWKYIICLIFSIWANESSNGGKKINLPKLDISSMAKVVECIQLSFKSWFQWYMGHYIWMGIFRVFSFFEIEIWVGFRT